MDQKDEIRDLKYQNSKIKGEKEKLENELIESQRKVMKFHFFFFLKNKRINNK